MFNFVSKFISGFKTYALAALGILSAVLAALFYREKANHAEAVRKGVEEARETEKKAVDAMIEGLESEQKEVEDAKNSTDRTHFN